VAYSSGNAYSEVLLMRSLLGQTKTGLHYCIVLESPFLLRDSKKWDVWDC